MVTLHTAPVEHGHLAFVDTGSGRPVVLLHGGALDHRSWSRQIPVLAERFRVIAPDARGHGESSTPVAPFRHCDDVRALLDHLGTGPAVLVGLSMGAGTAVDTAVEHPDLVDALVITGAGTSDPDWRDPWVLDRLATWARQAQDGDAAGWIETFLQIGAGPHRTVDDVDPGVLADLREQARTTVAVHVAGRHPVIPTPVPDIRRRVRAITVPLLALTGGLDNGDHVRMAVDLAEQVPHGRWRTITGAAHYPSMERPDEFNRLVVDFLDDLPPARP